MKPQGKLLAFSKERDVGMSEKKKMMMVRIVAGVIAFLMVGGILLSVLGT